jgi:hypothetical protein
MMAQKKVWVSGIENKSLLLELKHKVMKRLEVRCPAFEVIL